MFGTVTYPLSATSKVSSFADNIMNTYTRESLKSDLSDVSKKSWSDKSTAIA